MVKTKKTQASGGRIERRYLQLKLQRDKRRYSLCAVREYIGTLQLWLRQQPARTHKPGGIGR